MPHQKDFIWRPKKSELQLSVANEWREKSSAINLTFWTPSSVSYLLDKKIKTLFDIAGKYTDTKKLKFINTQRKHFGWFWSLSVNLLGTYTGWFFLHWYPPISVPKRELPTNGIKYLIWLSKNNNYLFNIAGGILLIYRLGRNGSSPPHLIPTIDACQEKTLFYVVCLFLYFSSVLFVILS